MSVLEEAGGQEAGWEEEEADPEVHSGLHSPCRGWHHGCCQLCEWTSSDILCAASVRNDPRVSNTADQIPNIMFRVT